MEPSQSQPTKMVHWMEATRSSPSVSHLDLAVAVATRRRQQQRRRIYHGGGGGEELEGSLLSAAPPSSSSPSSDEGEFRKKSGTWP